MIFYLAKTNPPYTKGGDNRPLFYNQLLKDKNPALTPKQVIAAGKSTFINRFFDTNAGRTGHQIAYPDFRTLTFRYKYNVNDDAYNQMVKGAYLMVENNDGLPNPAQRFYWITNVAYPQSQTIEIDAELDIWTTYQDIVDFLPDKEVEVERRMPYRWTDKDTSNKRYPNLAGYLPNSIDERDTPVPLADLNWTDPLPHDIKIMQDKAIPPKAIDIVRVGTPTNIDFFGFHKRLDSTGRVIRAYFYYAMITPVGFQYEPYSNKGDTNLLPTGCYFVPIAGDNIWGDKSDKSTNPTFNILNVNHYNNVASIPDAVMKGIYISTIPPYKDGQDDTPVAVDNLKKQTIKLSYGDAAGDYIIGFGEPVFENVIADPLNPFDDANPRILPTTFGTNQSILRVIERVGVDFTPAPFESYLEIFDPLLSTSTFTEFKIITFADSSAPLTPEMLFNPTTKKINLEIQQTFNINNGVLLYQYTPTQIADMPEYTFSKTYDGTLPSGASAWVNFMQQHKSSYTTSLLQNGFSGITSTGSSAINGFKDGGGVYGAGMGAVAGATGSFMNLANKMAQRKDMQRQPVAVHNNISKNTLLSMDYLLKHKDKNGNPIPSEYMSGFLARLGLPQDLKVETLKHYRLYGNPIKELKKIGWKTLHTREAWDYWQIKDITTAFDFSNLNHFIVDDLRALFNNGVRLWPVYTDKDYCNNYNLGNNERDLVNYA